MNYKNPLTPDEHEAYLSMPRNADGFVVSLFFVPAGEREALEAQWREWARGKQKYLHPNWFADWAEFKRSGIVPHYAKGLR
jgi:hypothetical protein